MAPSTISRFYECFKSKDIQGMQACYHSEATFTDPVFGQLNAREVKAMWEMLLKRAPDLTLTFQIINETNTSGEANWQATYIFSATNRKVINHVNSKFTLKDNLIIQQIDFFDFYVWAKQSLGLSGLLLGKTAYLKNKVRNNALSALSQQIKKSN